jgi:hypothetical protein
MSIVIQHRKTGRCALITTLFVNNNSSENVTWLGADFAYCRSFGQRLKCVEAGRMKIVKKCKSLPAAMFGKRKGPFLKLAPAPEWEIIDSFD